LKKIWKVAASVAAMSVLLRAEVAQATDVGAADVGAMEQVRQNVYGVAPQGGEAVKRKGDAVVFRETLQTLEDSSAMIRFIDDSKLSLGAKSKVVIDEFVFDPEQTKGNALIDISVGTLRFVTGDMPKGGVVIKTPTATLTLRGTDVLVHVHPDGTTDTTVYDGKVEAHNIITDEVTNMLPGEGATLGYAGTVGYTESGDSNLGISNADSHRDVPEHRRGDSPPERPAPERPAAERTSGNGDQGGTGGDQGGDTGGDTAGGDAGGDGDDGGDGCGCI
jgi:hypothetical protein